MTSKLDITSSPASDFNPSVRKPVLFADRVPGAIRGFLLSVSVLALVLFLLSNIDDIAAGRACLTYGIGGSAINYASGFVRRGLYGEIIHLMTFICQPVVAIVLLSSVSILFILYVFLRRMTRLNIGLPYILAILFSPSLFIKQVNDSCYFHHTDAFILAINIAASGFLMHLLFTRNKFRSLTKSFSGMILVDSLVFMILLVPALVHELSVTLMLPVMLLFFIFAMRAHRTLHCVAVADILIVVYAVMMTRFKYSDPGIISDSWSDVYQDVAWLKSNPGLTNVVGETQAVQHLNMSLSLIKEQSVLFCLRLLAAVAVPFAVLLCSGIAIFKSASSRAAVMRGLLLVSCLCPLVLSLAGIDFGRWFSICAINLNAYTLMIAHAAGRRRQQSYSAKVIEKMKSRVKICLVIATAAILINYRLHTFGYFYRPAQTIWKQTIQIVVNAIHLPEDIKPLLTREKVIQNSGC